MKTTQKQKIIKYMKEYGSITSWEAYMNLGITQLGARLKELKERGHQFEIKWEKKKNQEGKWVRFKRYYLWK